MQGRAYVFLRKNGAPVPLGCTGHVGWAFLEAEAGETPQPGAQPEVICGSTENFTGDPVIPPGADNGFWEQSFTQVTQMMQVMHLRGYDVFKVAPVPEPNPDAARLAALATRASGYKTIGNNSLDHVVKVLDAYGVKDLPYASMHPSPNEWFCLFNGEYHSL